MLFSVFCSVLVGAGLFSSFSDSVATSKSPADSLYEEADTLAVNVQGLEIFTIPSATPDSVFIQRLENICSAVPLSYNNIVRNYIILYSEKFGHKSIAPLLGRAGLYLPPFLETFHNYGVPEELAYLSVIESSLKPDAVSKVGAVGMWQFMYYTAKSYGLKIDSYVDERRDPDKSADAAARFLLKEYELFGDWVLALASYNCGTGNVNRAIVRSGGKRDFWSIYPYLPRETRGYVPAFIGALYLVNYYREHGIVPEGEYEYGQIDTFVVSKKLHFKQVNECVGVPMKTLRQLNPQYLHDIIPATASRTFVLKIPSGYEEKFLQEEKTLYDYKKDELLSPVALQKATSGATGDMFYYKVRSGDCLGTIARRYGVTVTQIKKWNNLSSDRINVGQKLVLYSKK